MSYTVEELNAQPWGNQTGAQSVQDVNTLNAADYSVAPFAQGLTAADYRAQHEADGEPFQLWHAYDEPGSNRNGKAYELATLGSIAKCRFHSTTREIEMPDFGLIPKGSTMLSVLPEVVEIVEGDKIVRTSPKQARASRASITRGVGDTDLLPHRFVTEVLRVSVNSVPLSVANVQVVLATGPGDGQGGGIKWLANTPAVGARIFVLYRYRPFYICLGESIQSEPIGKDGELLPQRVLLKEERD